MPPQPLNKVYPKAVPKFKFGTLFEQPQFTSLVMQTVSIWSMIDALLIQTVARFLKADFEVVTAIFEALAGANARREAYLAAAQEALSTEDFNIVRAVMIVIGPSRKRRNMFVHHIWGSAPELPDAILLAPPPVVTRYLGCGLN